MGKSNKIPWLKITGWAILIHALLIVTSILEVFIFSTLIKPNRDEVFYEQHAKVTAPYIAIIAGFVLIFLVARSLTRKLEKNKVLTGLLLALTYILIDVVLLFMASVNWSEHYGVFIISFLTKLLAAYLGASTNLSKVSK
ncbi:hypothetical protein GWK08_14325 [Leptobacterium flavescens]|uniref:Uncharacterized protein n=1 Tax=Leptobacterium flavescens TaxID=472055 RepID=A0A6P0URM6_9FLAO|nr:hypothetical protein [Leptobacterium flavescens]NER14628.1 hypothetical protein [Leptobacterium flavescens]